MNRKFLGVKIGTILTGVMCLAVALVFWMIVKYVTSTEALRFFELGEDCFRGTL